jgi:hypothetical protein
VTQFSQATLETVRGNDVLLSTEESVLLSIRGIVASLRGEGHGMTVTALERVFASKYSAYPGKAEQGGQSVFTFHGVKFHFQYPVEHIGEIEICFISDQF